MHAMLCFTKEPVVGDMLKDLVKHACMITLSSPVIPMTGSHCTVRTGLSSPQSLTWGVWCLYTS